MSIEMEPPSEAQIIERVELVNSVTNTHVRSTESTNSLTEADVQRMMDALPCHWWPFLLDTLLLRQHSSSHLELCRHIVFFFGDLVYAAIELALEDIERKIVGACGSSYHFQGKVLSECLLRSLGQGSLICGLLLRQLTRIPSIFCTVLSSTAELLSPSHSSSALVRPFAETVVGTLLRPSDETSTPSSSAPNASAADSGASHVVALLLSDNAAICAESWNILDALLTRHPPLTVEFLQVYFFDFVTSVCALLSHRPGRPGRFLQTWHALRLLTLLLGDPKFGKLRTALAESPALLCSVLHQVNDPSRHIRFEAYHCLKVFVAKQNKPPPIRYLLWLNRTAIAKFVMLHHDSMMGGSDGAPEIRLDPLRSDESFRQANVEERNVLLRRLSTLDPLSRDEMQLLSPE